VNLHTVFLREECILPDRFDLSKEPFCIGWTVAIGVLASEVDASIRNAGWHFMCMTDSHSSRGLGGTPEVAVHRALVSALREVQDRFNAAELGSIRFTHSLGLKMAKVTLDVRQIQKQASLATDVESHLQEGLSH
jgi:hypothetical protein